MLDAVDKRSEYLAYYRGAKKVANLRFPEYCEEVRAWASHLHEAGILPGDRVAVLAGNSLETFSIYSSLLYLGAVLVPLNPEDPLPHSAKILGHANAGWMVTTDRYESAARGLPGKQIVFRRQDPLPPAKALPKPVTDDVAVFYTSGTTGEPKGVVQTFASIQANLEATKRVGDLAQDRVLMSCLPLYHVNAFNFSFLLPLYLGCRIVFQEHFFQLGFWQIVQQEEVEVISLVPTIARLLVMEKRDPPPLPKLRYVISAASALPRDLLLEFRKKFGARINQAYGLSETVNFTLFTPPDLPEEIYREAMEASPFPSAGIPTRGNEITLVNEDGIAVDEPGVAGELCVRGWSIFREYLADPEATASALADGYFHTGDLAYFRDIGGYRFFYLCGRTKDIIKRNGLLIQLAEIDRAIREIGLENSCAVGFENAHTGEEVGLYTTGLPEGQAPGEVLRKLEAVLGSAKTPKVVVEGEQMPTTSVGKIRRKSLSQLFSPYREARFPIRP